MTDELLRYLRLRLFHHSQMLSSHLSLLLPSGAGGSTKVDLRDWGVVTLASQSRARHKLCRFDPTVDLNSGRDFLTTSSQPPAIGNWAAGVSGLKEFEEGRKKLIEHLNKLRRAKLRSDFVTEVKI